MTIKKKFAKIQFFFSRICAYFLPIMYQQKIWWISGIVITELMFLKNFIARPLFLSCPVPRQSSLRTHTKWLSCLKTGWSFGFRISWVFLSSCLSKFPRTGGDLNWHDSRFFRFSGYVGNELSSIIPHPSFVCNARKNQKTKITVKTSTVEKQRCRYRNSCE